MSPEPIWLHDDVVPAIHQRQLAENGGGEGVRDAGLLSSALARPKNFLTYGEPPPDLASLAAAYGFKIVRNHPCVDGNKRTGYVVCRTFLLLNGQDITATQNEKYLTFLQLAEGNLPEDSLAEWIRSRLEPATIQ